MGAPVEANIQPIVESISSARRSWLASPVGLTKKKSGSVATINH